MFFSLSSISGRASSNCDPIATSVVAAIKKPSLVEAMPGSPWERGYSRNWWPLWSLWTKGFLPFLSQTTFSRLGPSIEQQARFIRNWGIALSRVPQWLFYKASTVKFLTPCCHLSMDTHGNMCLDILKDKWSTHYLSGASCSIQTHSRRAQHRQPFEYASEWWSSGKTLLSLRSTCKKPTRSRCPSKNPERWGPCCLAPR